MDGAKRPRETASFHKQQCLSFAQKLWEADTLAMFHHPVSATEVPEYYDVIAEPMDLSTIRQKIAEDKYSTDSEVEDDVALMLSNALDFNAKGSPWHDLAKKIKNAYPAMAQQSGLAFDDDQVFIPTKKEHDDESTLRKEERKGDEKLDEVLKTMEKEKEIPLDELRLMYARRKAEAEQHSGSGSDTSSPPEDEGEEEEESEEDDSDSGDEEDSSSNSDSEADEEDED
ncbi:putative bromodomain factor 2 protein [Leptomonas pyrrhocoris]|uniref:Putative bromodomain factor 2 protein n=1 Tax=Leptomonas pyrrhocoris TaxID=157538 RepID=A0A0N0DW47_LEPPY|nr:putative bromodomain factor 2 protein [Leptomonas pyrrhocoris]XP_015659708.1 putative bromodomain factor 2 protein [Leptomonas pyrrhocoris]KPA81268.1 putative bromodomain factor 2 protein [Leptomonas pyrrhocoris]KPA81269.1 putative bromodomain factor 2 protein [Leptomonas pyrrhocoris]|eukprot:XP_015659707.1 putative bromodomain factor 2 protein [Leptomonas pyrrhocoris]